jgi:hypothetical protein
LGVEVSTTTTSLPLPFVISHRANRAGRSAS